MSLKCLRAQTLHLDCISKGKTCVCDGMRVFTLFSLYENSTYAYGRSIRTHDERQLVTWECQKWCMGNCVFESSEAVVEHRSKGKARPS